MPEPDFLHHLIALAFSPPHPRPTSLYSDGVLAALIDFRDGVQLLREPSNMSGNRYNPLSSASKLPMTAPSAPSSAPKPADEPQRPQPKKRKGHRGGKKKRSRRKSFAILDDDGHDEDEGSEQGFYQHPTRNLSGTSLDSEALLDHR